MRRGAVLATALLACSTFESTNDPASGGVDGSTPGVFAPAGDVRALAIDDTNVYWLTGAKLFTCPIAACDGGGPTLLAPVNNGKALAAGRGLVLFLDDNGLTMVAKTGGPTKNLSPLASGALGYAGGDAYFLQQGTISICRTPSLAGGCSSAMAFATVTPTILAAGSSTDLWWADPSGAIRSCSYGTCLNTRTLSTNELGVERLVVNEKYVYWSHGTSLRGATTASALFGAAAPPDNVSGVQMPDVASDLLLTGTSLFVSFAARGTVSKHAIPPAGDGTPVATGLPSPTVMASNGEVLFVACSGDSTLRKVSLSP